MNDDERWPCTRLLVLGDDAIGFAVFSLTPGLLLKIANGFRSRIVTS